jgi:hypothetical protein
MDIVVDVAPVKRTHLSEVPDGQFGDWHGNVAGSTAFVDQPFQHCFHGNALPPRFFRKAGRFA